MAQKRNSAHIRAQREGKELDQFVCFFCLKQFQGNHGHHIMLYSEGGEPSVNNMVTLCPQCHRDYHSGKIRLDLSRFWNCSIVKYDLFQRTIDNSNRINWSICFRWQSMVKWHQSCFLVPRGDGCSVVKNSMRWSIGAF